MTDEDDGAAAALEAMGGRARHDLDRFGPDGLAVDREGNLYVAEYGAGHLLIVSPERKLLATIDVPEDYVTAPALSLDETRIFITAPVSLFDPTEPGKVYEVANPVHPAD